MSEKLTEAHVAQMRSALGMDRKRASLRNWYVASVGSPDFDLWWDLCFLEYGDLVHVEDGKARFIVTDKGRRALSDRSKA